MKVVILAGGLGSRLSEYTKNIPKPMVPINKIPMIVYIMKHYSKYGFKDFYVAAGYKYQVIKDFFKKKNYGWNIREGAHSFMSNKTKEETTPPVFEYGRRSGGSITGGYVYRGIDIPHLVGKYIYSDYLSRRTWALTIETNDGDSLTTKKIAKGTPLSISSFGETPSGELIVCGFETPYARTGKIYTLVPLPISAKE